MQNIEKMNNTGKMVNGCQRKMIAFMTQENLNQGKDYDFHRENVINTYIFININ